MKNKKPKPSSRHINVFGTLFVMPKGQSRKIRSDSSKLKKKKRLEWKEYQKSME